MSGDAVDRINPPPARQWLVVLVLLAFAASLAQRLLERRPFVGNDAANAAIRLTLVLILSWVLLEWRKEDRATERFLRWLEENHPRVRNEGAEYEGTLILPETRVWQFEFCVSALLVRIRGQSRFLLEGEPRKARTRVLYCLVTLLLGWPALFGSFWMLTTLSTNLRETRAGTIDDLIHQLVWRRGSTAPIGLPRPGTEPAPPSGIWGMVRMPLAAVGVLATPIGLIAAICWILRKDVVIVDNTLDVPVTVSVDHGAGSELGAHAHREWKLVGGEHHVAVRSGSGLSEEEHFELGPRKQFYADRRGVYNVGANARYALVSVCYGSSCFGPPVESNEMRLERRYFAMPDAVYAGTDIDEAFPATMPAGERDPRTHLCHVGSDDKVACRISEKDP